MKIYQVILLFLLLACLQACNSVSGPVHFYSGQPRTASEVARLQIPAAITIVKINGKEAKVPSKDEGFYHVYLLPGVHRIDFKYELAWGDNVSGMLIRSDVVGVETRLYAGMNYDLTYTVPGGQEEAYEMAMATEFKARLIEKETGRFIASRSLSELDEFRILAVNMQEKITPEPTVKTKSIIAPAGINADTAVREDAVKRLKFWWLMANEKERKSFKEWMKQVEGIEKPGVE